MYSGLYTAVSGSLAQEKRLTLLTNNLANATTVGFKFDEAIFHAVNVPTMVGPLPTVDGTNFVVAPIDPLMARYTPQHPDVNVQTDFSQGPLRETGNPLDVALEGEGFFVVEMPNGEAAYTRQGSFTINGNGFLVTQSGLRVQGQQGPIAVSGGQISIDASGQITVDGALRDRLKLVQFAAPMPLEKMGDALFRNQTPDVTPSDAADLNVHQGTVEGSNSPLIRLLGAIIQTSRAYEAYQRTIQIFDTTAGRAVNDIAGT